MCMPMKVGKFPSLFAPSAGVVDKKLPELATGAHPTANWIAPLAHKDVVQHISA